MKITTFILLYFLFIFSSLTLSAEQFSELTIEQTAYKISDFVTDPAPWLHMAPNSEQRQPVYIGSTPKELSLGLTPKDGGKLSLYNFLKERAENQLNAIFQYFVDAKIITENDSLEIEGFPVRDDNGFLTWAFSRWKKDADTSWLWLDDKIIENSDLDKLSPKPLLPKTMNPQNDSDAKQIFNDILEFNSLYDKPLFGDCIWTNKGDNAQVLEGWLPLELRESYGKKISMQDNLLCRVFPQPARLNGNPISFILKVSVNNVAFPKELKWKTDLTIPKINNLTPIIKSWPENFKTKYKTDILMLDGEEEAVFPISRKKIKFEFKNNAEPNNQLDAIVEYLEERYKILGIKTKRQNFEWRGKPQSNLIAIITGSNESKNNKPVIMADHFDTAFCQDVFDKEHKRKSAPGADDNMTATAALLRAAEVLKDFKPKNDIWLAHLTGEEFPADDLGARELTGKMLTDKTQLSGIVLMDMIGARRGGDRIFQINAGDSLESLEIAQIALSASKYLNTEYEATLRTRFDERSYLYNTDGLIFSDAGYPVILLNEHINAKERLNRKGYHDMADNSKKINYKYATQITKIAIETAAQLAQ